MTTTILQPAVVNIRYRQFEVIGDGALRKIVGIDDRQAERQGGRRPQVYSGCPRYKVEM